MYATEADLASVFGGTIPAQLAGEKGASAVEVSVVVNAVLVDASATIDSFLGTRYVVPVVGADAILRPYCLAIAKWLLLERRAGGRYDEGASKGYDAAVDWLRSVAKGELSLAGAALPSAPLTPSTGAGGSEEAAFAGGIGF